MISLPVRAWLLAVAAMANRSAAKPRKAEWSVAVHAKASAMNEDHDCSGDRKHHGKEQDGFGFHAARYKAGSERAGRILNLVPKS